MSCPQEAGQRRKRNTSPGAINLASATPANPRVTQARMLCCIFHKIDSANFPSITQVLNTAGMRIKTLDQVPHCPPTRLTMFEAYPDQGENCFRSIQTFTPNVAQNFLQRTYEFISVCCYKEG